MEPGEQRARGLVRRRCGGGGVCGGLARVSGIESWVWRLIFALCTVFVGFGLLFYVLMWIFVPEE